MEITSVTTFLDYYERIRERTNRVIRCIPPDKMDWSYKPGKFTLADMVRHIALIERCMYAENVRGNPSLYHGCGKEFADKHDAVLAFFHRMHEESVAIFRNLSPADLQRKCRTPAGTEIQTWKWLRAMVEHEIHHRGQLYIFLNLLDVKTPPMFGLTAEEVQARFNS